MRAWYLGQTRSVYMVPTNLFPTNGSDISPSWVSWLAGIPAHAEVRFQPNASYGFGNGFNQAAPGAAYNGTGGAFPAFQRNDLVINGNGSTSTALTLGGVHRNTWSFCQCTGVTLENLTMVGPNPTIPISPPGTDYETQNPVNISSGSGITVQNITSTHSYGYHVGVADLYAGHFPTGTPAYPPPTNIAIKNCTFDNNGQQGIAFVCVAGAMVSGCTITGCINSIDIESSFQNEITRDITVTGCTLSPVGSTILSCMGYATGTLAYDGLPICRNIVFTNNICTPQSYTIAQPFSIRSIDGVVIPGVVVSGNTFNTPTVHPAPYTFPCTLANCSGLTFTNNTQHGVFNDRNYVLDVTGATGMVVVTGNTIDSGQPGTLLYGLSGTNTSGATFIIANNTNWPAANNLS